MTATHVNHLVDPSRAACSSDSEMGRLLKRYSTQGGFAEGDHVTRDGTDVHVVRNMTDCGTCADFECIRAPAEGWIAVGEVEHNLCRRYSRILLVSALASRKARP
jgi:hypothetical protein